MVSIIWRFATSDDCVCETMFLVVATLPPAPCCSQRGDWWHRHDNVWRLCLDSDVFTSGEILDEQCKEICRLFGLEGELCCHYGSCSYFSRPNWILKIIDVCFLNGFRSLTVSTNNIITLGPKALGRWAETCDLATTCIVQMLVPWSTAR